MADPTSPLPGDPREMSQAELEEYLDRLVQTGQDDSPEFYRAHRIWEKNQ